MPTRANLRTSHSTPFHGVPWRGLSSCHPPRDTDPARVAPMHFTSLGDLAFRESPDLEDPQHPQPGVKKPTKTWFMQFMLCLPVLVMSVPPEYGCGQHVSNKFKRSVFRLRRLVSKPESQVAWRGSRELKFCQLVCSPRWEQSCHLWFPTNVPPQTT